MGISAKNRRVQRYHEFMLPDQPRPAATPPDSEFSLSIDDALERYAKAGRPRTPRSVQRYCAKGHLECRLVETAFGEKWMITPESVDKHISYIEEVTPSTGRDLTRPAATSRDDEIQNPTLNDDRTLAAGDPRHPSTSPDLPRPVASNTDRYVNRLEGENEFLRSQIVVKDTQIKELTERAMETNHLILGLQRMLTPLLGSNEHRKPTEGDMRDQSHD